MSAPAASLIVPSYNEAGSVGSLVAELNGIIDANSLDIEVIIVDDMSPDGTADAARTAIAESGAPEGRWRVLSRDGPRGLTPAVAYGFDHAEGKLVGVCDADGSHDLRILPRMLEHLASDQWDLVVGSRYIPGGGADDTWPMKRLVVSRLAAFLPRPMTPVRDPMAGFFILRKELLERAPVGGKGYKVLLELLVRAAPERVIEVPYIFKDREAGQSKLSGGVIFRDLWQLIKLYCWRLAHPLTRTRVWKADGADRSPGARK